MRRASLPFVSLLLPLSFRLSLRLPLLLLAFPLLLAPAAAQAQGWILPRCGGVPRPLPDGDVARPPIGRCPPGAVVRTGSTVTAELRGRVVHYEIEERFENRGGTLGEADYYFPLPRTAAFQSLALSIDGEMVAGETMGAGEARGIYEAIVRQQRDPALVEWMGHGLLRLRIFPFRAGEERRVVVRLQAVAEREGDAVRVDYARGAGRGRGAGPRGLDDRELDERGARGGDAPVRFTLTYPTDAGYGRPYSPTHSLDVSARGGMRRVAVRDGAGDVTILLPMQRATTASLAMLAHAPAGEDGFALITVTPPAATRGATTPRDLTFVVDVSGSMSGRKLEQAKAAGRQLLASLRPADRFRIIDFSSDARTFRSEFVAATDENVRAAQRYLARLEAEGGTNISGALDEALREPPARGRLGVVLFLTDGEPTAGVREPARIAERAAAARRGRRVFTFGVGADVNAALVEQLALDGGGTAHFVRPDESVEHAVALVASRLTDPVLTDVRVRADGVRLSRLHPVLPVDLFAGQDLVLLARYAGSGRARLVVEGTSSEGAVRWTQEVTFPARERDNAFVARLWATQRVGWLSAEKRKGGSGSRELDDEIRQLGERFGIPTEFTSYLVLEPGAVAGNRVTGRVAGAAPSSVSAAPSRAAEFESARQAAQLRATRSLADRALVEQSAGSGVEVRGALGRTFTRDASGRWTDTKPASGSDTVRVAPYSEAYFALVRALPALREPFALGDHVLIAGDGVALEIVAGGATELRGAELRRIVGALDGRGDAASGTAPQRIEPATGIAPRRSEP